MTISVKDFFEGRFRAVPGVLGQVVPSPPLLPIQRSFRRRRRHRHRRRRFRRRKRCRRRVEDTVGGLR